MTDERVLKNWVQKEFIHTLRHKGKADTPTTLARDRKMAEIQGSMSRVFPHRDEAARKQEEHPAYVGRPKPDKTQKMADRRALQARVVDMQHQLESERRQREVLMEELNAVTATSQYHRQS
mmetsp:Transcript_34371/g.64799  ORF Transcript_34371/g.64799 Transcript_34371/m.64799 type:complete len:121 (+) Transcript_34371:377-739(+)|eukprot:CAMPEP_0114249790 /NCGR_PEP_ID=MMETSP0058-20121206/14342_1 /TAXON_ID=36894 /ORGANISM="Pyramimonas parkeae, CCMP726" /LENGTH=120 /DNA_ID=CAMNT_0001363383 /DNA_START=368 /DNA_END=730 /DNA_ORIENTATION=-